jgi:glycosyltransferase involved in cell wall biosynthesis
MKTAFLIAAHYPPAAMAVGAQRTVHLALALKRQGWRPIVLTIAPSAMEMVDQGMLDQSPVRDVEAVYTFCVNARKSFSIRGRYLDRLTVPDPWWTWQWFVRADLKTLLRKVRPDLIWSTFPVASAHLIASRLKRQLNVPWIADFRDPPVGTPDRYSGARARAMLRLEELVAAEADHCTFASESAAHRLFMPRHGIEPGRISVVPNGFDAALLDTIAAGPDVEAGEKSDCVFLHSGHIYSDIRNPKGILEALHRIKQDSPDDYRRMKVRFRGSSREDFIACLLDEIPVRESVELLPPVPHNEAVSEMLRSQALVLIQRSPANCQIPAKVYEYLAMNRPILALVDPAGDTAQVLREFGVSPIIHPDDASGIARAMMACLDHLDLRSSMIPETTHLALHTRQARSLEFVRLFERICG